MRDLFLLIRPWQWTKNLFIFLPLFFALQLNNFHLLAKAGLAFVFFCLLASGIYIFNDYHDREEDRRHPKKKMRSLAAGRVTAKSALTVGVLLTMAGLLGAWLLDMSMLYLALFYLVLNISYTIKFKHVPLLDIFIIALGFVIRIFVGGVVTGVMIYPWIIVMTFLLSLFLALGKRRDDVLLFLDNGEKSRKSVDGYTLNFVDNSMVAMAAVTIVSYIMYTMSSEIIAKFKTDHLYLTTVFVILGIMRYLQITMVEQRSADPSEILLKDSFIQISILGWITMFGLLIYLR
jgi:decaprenyl-phosphate phosphoribosyltransferase